MILCMKRREFLIRFMLCVCVCVCSHVDLHNNGASESFTEGADNDYRKTVKEKGTFKYVIFVQATYLLKRKHRL